MLHARMTSSRRSRPTAPPRRSTPSDATTLPAEAVAAPAVFPSWREIADPRGPYLVPLLLLLTGRVALWMFTRAPAEDAFITFRYARNLASGHGLVYNPGEHVMGFTSPLWTLWSALGAFLLKDPVTWGRASGIAADVVTLLVGGQLLARTLSRASAWTFTFFFAAWPYFAAVGVSGMEMSLAMALIVTSAALVSARSVLAGPALAALALTRPEGVAAALVIALGASWRDRAIAAGLFALAVGALALQFGNPIPNSLLAKAHVYGTPGPWAGRHWWEWLSPVVLGRWPGIGDTALMIPLTIVMAAAFAVGVRELWHRRDTAIAHAAGAALAIWLGYSLVGAAYFWWYLSLPLLGVTLCAAAGFPRIVRGAALPVSVALLVLSVWTLARQLYIGRSDQESLIYGYVARQLALRCKPGDSVLLEPIGIVGYTAPVRVIDETGLVSPEVARRRLAGPGWYTDVVAERKPDWLVVRQSMLQSAEAFAGAGQPFRNPAERDSIEARYHIAARSTSEGSTDAMLLMKRLR